MKAFKYGAAVALALALAGTLIVAGCGEKLAAKVNGTGIPMSKVESRLNQVELINKNLFQGKDGERAKREYRNKILDYLINEQLVRQEAVKQKIAVSDKEVDARFNSMVKASKKSLKDIEKILKDQGTSVAEFKDGLKTQMIAQKLFQKVTTGIKVTDAQVKDYYEKNKETEFKEPEKVRAQQILTANEEDAKKAKQELDNEADFAAAAKKYSIDPSTKDKGGELPPFTKDQVVPEWANEVFAKNPGEMTGIFKTSFGYHIVKVLEKIPAKEKTFDEVKNSIKQRLLATERDKAFQEWLSDLKKKSDVKTYI